MLDSLKRSYCTVLFAESMLMVGELEVLVHQGQEEMSFAIGDKSEIGR